MWLADLTSWGEKSFSAPFVLGPTGPLSHQWVVLSPLAPPPFSRKGAPFSTSVCCCALPGDSDPFSLYLGLRINCNQMEVPVPSALGGGVSCRVAHLPPAWPTRSNVPSRSPASLGSRTGYTFSQQQQNLHFRSPYVREKWVTCLGPRSFPASIPLLTPLVSQIIRPG